MKWIGRLSTFLVLQILFVGILLAILGRIPKRELELAWEVMRTGQSPLDRPPPPAGAAPPKEDVSYSDLVRARANEALEIERQRRELEGLNQAAQSRMESASSSLSALKKLRDSLTKESSDKEALAIRSGRAKVLDLLESMQPKLAKSYLLDQSSRDEATVLEVIKQLDPVVAAKIFKEFKQPADQGKLNGWLAKLGQGDPEATTARRAKEMLSSSPPANQQ